jgi:hypothetical protein
MNSMIQNLINGNLTDARHRAKRFSLRAIVHHLHIECGWSVKRSNYAAVYLKTGTGFQLYCDEN